MTQVLIVIALFLIRFLYFASPVRLARVDHVLRAVHFARALFFAGFDVLAAKGIVEGT